MAALGVESDAEMTDSSDDTDFSDINNDGESTDTSTQSEEELPEGVSMPDFSTWRRKQTVTSKICRTACVSSNPFDF